jgi:hypothetical protein
MDLSLVLICEYIFNEHECRTYLKSINVDQTKYEYIFMEFNVDDVKCVKAVRKLTNVLDINLTKYKNIMKIRFHDGFNRNICISNNTRLLIFGCNFNKEILRLPDKLIQLEFGLHFNCKLPHFPDTLIYLKLGYCFNQEITRLTNKLQYLILGHYFNHKLPELPMSLIHLSINDRYTHKLDIPNNLIHLRSGHNFKQHMLCLNKLKYLVWNCDKILPILSHSITHLDIRYRCGFKFTKLPRHLTYLKIEFRVAHHTALLDFEQEFKQCIIPLPSKLIKLIWNCDYKLLHLPHTLKHLTLGRYYDELPELHYGLEYLNVGCNYSSFNKKLPTLPKTLTHLLLGNKYDQPLPTLPDTLLELTLGKTFNYKLPTLPFSLTRLIIGDSYDHELIDLPENLVYLHTSARIHKFTTNRNISTRLTYLYLNNNFNGEIPITLIELEVDDNVNTEIKTLPSTLKKLIWDNKMKLPRLPDDLEYLEIGYEHNHPISKLSPKLRSLNWQCDIDFPKFPRGLRLLRVGGFCSYKLKNISSTIKKIIVEFKSDEDTDRVYSNELNEMCGDRVSFEYWI